MKQDRWNGKRMGYGQVKLLAAFPLGDPLSYRRTIEREGCQTTRRLSVDSCQRIHHRLIIIQATLNRLLQRTFIPSEDVLI